MRMTGDVKQQGALFAALAAAQGAFPPIERNKTVKVTMKSGGTYTFDYADLDEVLSKTRGPLSDNGLCFFQALGEKETKEGTIGVLTSVLAHKDGATIEDEQAFSLGGSNQDMGGDITYKRRYAASAMLGIAAETDDDGGTGNRSKAEGRELADRPRRQPATGSSGKVDEAEYTRKLSAATSIRDLTALFNALDVEYRRPGTALHTTFQARRKELAPDAE